MAWMALSLTVWSFLRLRFSSTMLRFGQILLGILSQSRPQSTPCAPYFLVRQLLAPNIIGNHHTRRMTTITTSKHMLDSRPITVKHYASFVILLICNTYWTKKAAE